MSDDEKEDLLKTVEDSVDLSIILDNILGIADFVMEKHEFKYDLTLTPEQREQAAAKIKKALWAQVEELKLEHKTVLREMFVCAENALAEVMDGTN